jgi:predicted nucleic acid-binding protein
VSVTVLLDTGPLVAFLSADDAYHDWAQERWRNLSPPLLSCEAVITEAAFLLQRQDKSRAGLFALIQRGVVKLDFSLTEELPAVAALVDRYANVPMSLADACLVRMSEFWADARVFTLDEDFHLYRRHGRQAIPLIEPR